MNRTFFATAAGILLALVAVGGVAAADDLSRGETLFALCQQCHGPEAHGDVAIGAPSIAGLEQWYIERQLGKFRTGIRGNHPDDTAGLRMAPMAKSLKSEDDVRAVAAYVASLPVKRPPPTMDGGNPEQGRTYFAVCTACHGPEAAGNQQLGAPPLRNANDWYLFQQLGNFRAGIRGANPADTFGLTMRPMSLTLPDEQAMRDVIAYVMSLSN